MDYSVKSVLNNKTVLLRIVILVISLDMTYKENFLLWVKNFHSWGMQSYKLFKLLKNSNWNSRDLQQQKKENLKDIGPNESMISKKEFLKM